MIGVIYAPNPTEQITEEVEPVRRDDTRTPTSGTGERKMNVVRGASMFVKKDERIKDVGWGTWVWNNLFVGERKEINVGVVAGTQSPVGKALRGLSETVFGF